ncbi:MAG: aminopeptidase [Bdellovibrionales bacterium]|jgi:predicted aminopeptidase|nr:aminopeptidase [Bdellovibrionales bacterium]
MKWILLLFSILNFSSCTKFIYIIEQGQGQLSLLHKAKDNDKILRDVTILPKHKDKIRTIQNFKDYFYRYFNLKPTRTYSKTSFLNRDAVTYLVIASPHNKIQAIDHCFPFLGCFPYLGFFDPKSAHEFRKDLEKGDYVTYQRPVYAYSTTGYFNDPILSSFFRYKDFDLAELIFHELFHTIFFIKNEVDLNENLANYFGRQLALEYFQKDKEFRIKIKNEADKVENLKRYIVEGTSRLQNIYEKRSPKGKKESELILKDFLDNDFIPGVKSICAKQKMKRCFALERKWNNASFSAYLTYEKDSEEIEKLHRKLKLSLFDYFKYIKMAYEKYEGENFSKDFFKR